MDEIVAFSGVERFLDTPLKHYSSGMQVRLAFAVAAHLNPEILLVDEVLSVGDAEFQKKSMEKMNSLDSEQGKTIIFVSHNMTAVKSFCNRVVVLNNGKIEFIGSAENAISNYINTKSEKLVKINQTDTYQYITVQSISVKAKNKTIEDDIELSDEIEITTIVDVHEIPSNKFHITLVVNNSLNDPLFTTTHWTNDISLKKGKNRITCLVPSKFLNIGTYNISVYVISNIETIVYLPSIIQFIINEDKKIIGEWFGKEPGYFLPLLKWKVNYDI
jgi:lipopolysaccharide transport system ATP-binding protein